jgi:hypothetical protein
MTKGYLILAQNSSDDYVDMAASLAMSIKVTQKQINSVSLVTDIPDAVPHHYRDIFDKVIQIPWYDDAADSNWKIENRWKLYHVTPYDETIILDADMLFLSDVSNRWNYLSKNHELFITDCVQTYRNEIITDDFYRRAFTKNKLPNTYSAYTYFKKSDLCLEFWKWVELICKNWKEFYQTFLTDSRPQHLSIDVAFALAVKIMGIEDKVFSKADFPTFIHMKGAVQNWQQSVDDWNTYIDSYFTDKMSIKIGNFHQRGILHYTEKSFLDSRRKEILYNLYKETLDG